MKCPKCGIEQAGTEQCAGCGLIFEKYRRYQELREQGQGPTYSTSPSSSRRGGFVLWTVLGVCVLSLGTFFIFKGGDPAPSQSGSQPLPVVVAVQAEEARNIPSEAVDTFGGLDLIAQLEANVPPGNLTEKARNATVLIQTPWGRGAGFFVDEKCSVITNKHVVRLTDRLIANVEGEIRKANAQAERLKANIQHNRKIYQDIQCGKARMRDSSITSNELRSRLQDDEDKLNEFLQEIVKKEDALNQNKWNPSFSIVLADGTKLDGSLDYVSEEQDLALVRPFSNMRCPTIPVGDSSTLNQGETLFTIGSPMGIRHVVTSGVFSGTTEVMGQMMLQTDAPINPGNSGGPLIDKEGQVVGINTLLLNNSEGIGFAIPIDRAVELFSTMGVSPPQLSLK